MVKPAETPTRVVGGGERDRDADAIVDLVSRFISALLDHSEPRRRVEDYGNDIVRLVRQLAATTPVPSVSDEGLRAAGEGYEVRTWVKHEPSGVVVLKGHPQLGGRYCKTDGGDWPCASVRAALSSEPERKKGETDVRQRRGRPIDA